MREIFGKTLCVGSVVLSVVGPLGYAIPVSPVDRAIGQECAASISALKDSRQQHQRCIQRIGGKETTKAAQCRDEKEKVTINEVELENCKLLTSRNVIEKMAIDQEGTGSAG